MFSNHIKMAWCIPLILLSFFSYAEVISSLSKDPSAHVSIVKTEQGYQLRRNGQPYFIKGVGGGRSKMENLVKAGGNSIRLWNPDRALMDLAHQHGLTVMLGIDLARAHHGHDYRDEEVVAKQLAKTKETVLAFKDHPALLMWGLGNELELSHDDRLPIWKTLNKIALLVNKLDPNHPTAAIIAGTGKNKLRELLKYAPAINAVGINSYGAIVNVPKQLVLQKWDKPFIITEFGPIGHWEVNKTPWGLPLEPSSTEKGDHYVKAYQVAVNKQKNALGSYAFLWGHKQEKTHTWYGMLLPFKDQEMGAVDAISYGWRGHWPENRAPRIVKKITVSIEGESQLQQEYAQFSPGQIINSSIQAKDPDGQPMTFAWDIRLDVSDNKAIGGDKEESVKAISHSIISQNDNQAQVKIPSKKGNYRLFVYVYDTQGKAATTNLPIKVI